LPFAPAALYDPDSVAERRVGMSGLKVAKAPGGRRGAALDLALWALALLAGLIAISALAPLMAQRGTLLQLAAPFHMLVLFLVSSVLLRRRGERWRDLGVARPASWRRVAGLVALGYVAGIAVNGFCTFVVFKLLHLLRPDFTAIGELKGHLGTYLYWLTVALVSAALGEELQFRGFVWSRLERLAGGGRAGTIFALSGQALLFSLGHIYQGLSGVIVTGGLGLVLGFVYLAARRSLIACMILHGLIDSVSLTALFLLGTKALQAGV
jgi:membrane protease YdiL (CAAX protease family)